MYDAISLRHVAAVAHDRKRTRMSNCPASRWPARHEDGFEAYSQGRRILNDGKKKLHRTDQEHSQLRNQLMHLFMITAKECSRRQDSP